MTADDLHFLLPFIVIVVTYILFFVSAIHKQNYLNKLFLGLQKLHFGVIGANVFFWILSKFGIQVNVFYFSELLAWAWLISACLLILSYRFTNNFMENYYLNALLFSPFLLILPWGVPMFGAFVNYSFANQFYKYRADIIFNDSNFLVYYDHVFLGFDYQGELWEKKGPVRVSRGELPDGWTFGKEVIKIENEGNQRFHFYYLDVENQLERDTVIIVK